jgi:cell division protein FtsW (lipid II flippase)
LYASVLTVSPAVREHSWTVPLRGSHWIGFAVWVVVALISNRLLARALPAHDQYIFPCVALLSGWGVLTIWRLDPSLGARQVVWFTVGALAGSLIIARSQVLDVLWRHKLPLLAFGLILTALTLLLGVNPSGFGPRLWLGCCGFYLQPSEPLKLALVIYLAADLADRVSPRGGSLPLLLPTLLVSGLALALLIVQRDLGTACIFILLNASILYVATGKRMLLLATAAALALAGITGFIFIDIVHSRIETWINPWNDPTGRSYQVVQSLISIANGGVLGRGPGLGSPGLVPVAQSDFIFASIAEENGIVGTVGLLFVYALLLSRGLVLALRANGTYRRLLAAGLTSYLGIQALFIIGGNLRVIPLAGVTLPFLSYGGSSLLTALLAALILLAISADSQPRAPLQPLRPPVLLLASTLAVGFLLVVLTQIWWSVLRGADLLNRSDNARRSIADRYVPRGQLTDRTGLALAETRGLSGSLRRVYLYPGLGSIIGYTHPVYGQAGLESSLDPYLRGLQGNPPNLVWWDQLVYGTPPPGVDLRLTLDTNLQERVDDAMRGLSGAVILLDARSGDILVMASHPTYDANELGKTGAALAADKSMPLLNRATQGLYPPGDALSPLLATLRLASGSRSGTVSTLYNELGFNSRAISDMPAASPTNNTAGVLITPLHMAASAAALSNAGVAPAPRIVLAMKAPQQGWTSWPASGAPRPIFAPVNAMQTSSSLAVAGRPYWEWSGTARTDTTVVTWYVAGTLPGLPRTPLCAVVLLEGDVIPSAQTIGRALLAGP